VIQVFKSRTFEKAIEKMHKRFLEKTSTCIAWYHFESHYELYNFHYAFSRIFTITFYTHGISNHYL